MIFDFEFDCSKILGFHNQSNIGKSSDGITVVRNEGDIQLSDIIWWSARSIKFGQCFNLYFVHRFYRNVESPVTVLSIEKLLA